jgi:3-hydroxy-5-methyl-1-naphthoate 3-O-methyltransferase
MKLHKNKLETMEAWLELGRSYQAAAVFTAAAELDLFGALAGHPLTATEAARKRHCNRRGVAITLDALAAQGLIKKQGDRYSLLPGTASFLTLDGSKSILSMARHQANCLRHWAQLAAVVKSGRPAERKPGLHGEKGDREAFIWGMHNISAPVAGQVIRAIEPLQFNHLLDIGGGPGTWTIAFLRACPSARATLFDLPAVIPLSRRGVAQARLSHRVRFVAGDFMKDTLPPETDLAWVSAIVHQNSRSQNQCLFGNVFQALTPGGRMVIRDVLMAEDHVQPLPGALFAVNMLVATPGGGTYTFSELREDMESVGFTEARVLQLDDAMHSLVVATKPNEHQN